MYEGVTLYGTQATDASGTITTGGTAQMLFAAGLQGGFEVINPDASEDLWINPTGDAVANGQGCIRVAANGGSYTTPLGMKPINHAVSIVAATGGHKFSAWSW